MSTVTTATATLNLTKITRDQHIDYMTRPDFEGGRYWYQFTGESTDWFIGIDRIGGVTEQVALQTKAELDKWFDERSFLDDKAMPAVAAEAPVAPIAPTPPVLPPLPKPQEQTLFEGVPGPLFDESDPMAVLQQAQGAGSSQQSAVSSQQPEPGAVGMEERLSALGEPHRQEVDALKTAIQIIETDWLAAFRRANSAEARLKAKQQEFEQANADLIAEQKAAKAEKEKLAEGLRTEAAKYGKLTGDKKFDAYISMYESEVITWDDAKALDWLKTNYQAAIVPPTGERVDEKRFTEYVKDCRKREQELPPSVTIATEWGAKLSTKVEEVGA